MIICTCVSTNVPVYHNPNHTRFPPMLYAVFLLSPVLTSQLFTILFCISDSTLTYLCTSCVYSVYLSFYRPLTFLHHPCSIHHFDHLLFYSLIILFSLHTFQSFYVFACEYSLHVISCALLHPSLFSPYHSLWLFFVHFYTYSLLLWLLHTCLTLYI